jgi:HlyD family secretion protein
VNIKKWITMLVVVAVIAGGAYWYFTAGKASANVSEKDLITVQRVDFPVIVNANGMLEATKSVIITPPDIRRVGRFKLIRMVDEGTNVAEGDFLMEFDTSDIARNMRDLTASFQREQENRQNKRSNFDLNLKNQKLSLEQAKSDLQKLEVKMESQVDLLSGIEVEKTRIQRDSSRKNVASMEKKIELMTRSGQLDLQISTSNENNYRRQMDDLTDATDACIVRAPVAGVVIYKRMGANNDPVATIGSTVQGGFPIMELPDLSTIVAKVQVDEVDSGKLKLGQEVNISVGTVRGRTFNGKVQSECTILKPVSYDRPQKICDTYIALDKADLSRLRPGMTLTAKIMVGQYSKVAVIPLSSIQERDGRSFVQVWQPETKSFSWREIQLKTNDGITAVIESGLNANEKIRVKPKA